jgi:hypothetical protein
MASAAGLADHLLGYLVDHGDDVMGGESITGTAPAVDLAAYAQYGAEIRSARRLIDSPRNAGNAPFLNSGGSSAGLIAGVLAGKGADAGQGGCHPPQVGYATAKLAFNGGAVDFRSSAAKLAVMERETLDGQVCVLDDLAVLGTLLRRVDEECYVSNLICQLLNRRCHAAGSYSHDQARNSTVVVTKIL